MKNWLHFSIVILAAFLLSCSGKNALEFNNYIVQNQEIVKKQIQTITAIQEDSITQKNYKSLVFESKKLVKIADSCQQKIASKQEFKNHVFHQKTIRLFESYKQIGLSLSTFYTEMNPFLDQKSLSIEQEQHIISHSISLQKATMKLDSIEQDFLKTQQQFANEFGFTLQ